MLTFYGIYVGGLLASMYFILHLLIFISVMMGKKERKLPKPFKLSSMIMYLLGAMSFFMFKTWTSSTPKNLWVGLFPCVCSVLLSIAIYDTLLLLLLPLLRKFLSAGFLYMLWLIPDSLCYVLAVTKECVSLPKFVVTIPRNFIIYIVVIWGIGAFSVMGWKIFSHITYSQKIMDGAEEVLNQDILSCYYGCGKKLNLLGMTKKLPLYYSDHVVTPLTIGIFRKKIILPRIQYSNVDLRWIFYHELMHVSKEDIGLKLFITICNAVCWFIPTMWFLLPKVAEDIELCCDELVLEGVPEKARHTYANLILKTGGNAKGFSTCLSATGVSMRYRLKNIIHPKKKRLFVEMILGTMVIFVLTSTIGMIQISYQKDLGKNMLFDGQISKLEIQTVNYEYIDENPKSEKYQKLDKTFKEFLENETFSELPGMKNLYCLDYKHRMMVELGDQDYFIEFEDHYMQIEYDSDDTNDTASKIYYMSDTNWEKLF